MVCLTTKLYLPAYLHANVGLSGPLDTALPHVLSVQLPISTPSTGLDECVFFNSLVVRLPYSSIFWQLSLLFVFKFVVIFY